MQSRSRFLNGNSMQKIKSVVVGMMVLAVFLSAFTLLIPRHVTITRGIEIPVPRDSLQAYLEDLPAWPAWCSWMGKDSIVTRKFINASPGNEATVTWFPTAQPYNKNFISILQAIPGEVRLYYQFGGLLPASGGFTLTGNGGSTFLVWKLEVKLRWYPWEKLSGIAMDKVWGTSMAQSLKHLKAVMMHMPPPPDDNGEDE